MADAYVQVPPQGSGLKVDTSELTVNSQTVERQRINIADPTTAAALAAVANSQPAGSEYGVIVREAQKGQGTMANSRPVALASDQSSIPVTMGSLSRTSAAWTSATGLNTALSTAITGYSTVIVTLVATSTMTGGVISFEASDDGGTSWFSIAAVRINAFTSDTTFTLSVTTQAWQIDVAGFTNYRTKLSTVITGSGTATVAHITSAAAVTQSVVVGQSAAANLQTTAVLATGSAIVGKVTTDQTTHGTTDLVAADITKIAGTAPTTVGKLDIKGADGDVFVRNATAANFQTTQVPATPTGHTLNSAATTNATSVKASAANVYQVVVSNVSASARFFKLYNKASAPTVGTDVPVVVLALAASCGAISIPIGPNGMRFTTGLAYAITGAIGDSDTTAIVANDVKVLISYA